MYMMLSSGTSFFVTGPSRVASGGIFLPASLCQRRMGKGGSSIKPTVTFLFSARVAGRMALPDLVGAGC